MTQEESNGREGLLTRREMLGATTVLGGMAVLGGGPTAGSAKAQTNTEPRIQLGPDYTIDDDPNGNGDLVVTHGPSGNAFTYDSTAGEWTVGAVNVDTQTITNTGAEVYESSSTSIPSGTFTKVEFDAVVDDDGGDYDSSTNYQFTVPRDGDYMVVGMVGIPHNADGTDVIGEIVVNATSYRVFRHNDGGVNYTSAPISKLFKSLAVGDTIHIEVYQDGGSTVDTRTGRGKSSVAFQQVA